jgi:hypothetical protein
MHDSPHSSKTIISSKRIVELLHVDLFDPPSHASLGGKKYCLVIVDDYSRFGIKGKLAPRFIGPFKVLSHKGEVAYELELPEIL